MSKKIYKIETELGTFHAVRVSTQPFQHPSEVQRGETYEQCTPSGEVVLGPKLFTGVSEADVLAAGGVLVSGESDE